MGKSVDQRLVIVEEEKLPAIDLKLAELEERIRALETPPESPVEENP